MSEHIVDKQTLLHLNRGDHWHLMEARAKIDEFKAHYADDIERLKIKSLEP